MAKPPQQKRKQTMTNKVIWVPLTWGFQQRISLQYMFKHHRSKLNNHSPTTTVISLDWFMQWAAVSINFSFKIVPPQNSSPSSFNRTACERKKGKCRIKKCSLTSTSYEQVTDFSAHYIYATTRTTMQASPKVAYAHATDGHIVLWSLNCLYAREMFGFHITSLTVLSKVF